MPNTPNPVTATWHCSLKSNAPAPLNWQIKPGLRWELNAVRNQLRLDIEGQPNKIIALEQDFRPQIIEEIRNGKAYRVFGQIEENEQYFTLLKGKGQTWYSVGKGGVTGAKGRVNIIINERNSNKIER